MCLVLRMAPALRLVFLIARVGVLVLIAHRHVVLVLRRVFLIAQLMLWRRVFLIAQLTLWCLVFLIAPLSL